VIVCVVGEIIAGVSYVGDLWVQEIFQVYYCEGIFPPFVLDYDKASATLLGIKFSSSN
jgi:hypothetical protein